MTSAIFEAKEKDDLKYFVALARKQGIVVRYLNKQNNIASKENNIVSKLYGSWQNDIDVNEMLTNIYSSRTSNDKCEGLFE
ncbi:MAG: hypothetical protein FWF51_03640 [Chitinivibrionia bacterium]|nr:hypothetical protein [Chitinivibrionia bacterium]